MSTRQAHEYTRLAGEHLAWAHRRAVPGAAPDPVATAQVYATLAVAEVLLSSAPDMTTVEVTADPQLMDTDP